ncbi:hypothetical protein [Paraburkholderia sp. SIMBA_030]|uniref:hypothetical protein n=1 Tax=Paraburkholderia sp. SIMBA_030 TaxID=3085773 RepID=UPI00397C6BBD
MNILFPHIDTVRFDEGPICFDALVDGTPINCILTAPGLSAATPVDHVISRREAFVLGQPALREVVARRVMESRVSPIVITQAAFDA